MTYRLGQGVAPSIGRGCLGCGNPACRSGYCVRCVETGRAESLSLSGWERDTGEESGDHNHRQRRPSRAVRT